MNKILMAWLSGATILVVSAQGQAIFQNLDFEAGHNLPGPFGSVAATNALPGWTAFSGTNQLSVIPYNEFAGVPKVGLYGSNSSVISGNFDVSLSDGGSINQAGLVPADSESLLFKGWWPSLPPTVSLNGQDLLLIPISNAPSYTLYGADVSAFAGQEATLTFLTLLGVHDVFIDDIQFSTQTIPETSTLALFAVGSFFIAVHLGARVERLQRVEFDCEKGGVRAKNSDLKWAIF